MRWLCLAVVAAGCMFEAPSFEGPVPPCGTGRWRLGRFEIHHLDIGQADATLVIGPTGRSLLIDVGEPVWDDSVGARLVGAYVKDVLGCAHLDQVVLTHFHYDHVGQPYASGLWHLAQVQGFSIGKTLHRDLTTFVGAGGVTLGRWRRYLTTEGRALLHPEVIREGRHQIDLGRGVTTSVIAVDGHGAIKPGDFSADRAPPNENDYSVVLLLRFGRLDYLIGGDLSGERWSSTYGYSYHDIETAVARSLSDVDVYRVHHHGSDHASSTTLLAQIDPEVSIVSVGRDNPFGHPHRAVLDRLRTTSTVFVTSAGPVVVRTLDGVAYTVADHPFRAGDPHRSDADGDGYFREADPDDSRATIIPAARGGCDALYQPCEGNRDP